MKFRLAFVVVLVAALLASTVSGDALAKSTAKNLSTNYTLVNFGSTDAAVSVSYLKDAANNGAAWTADAANTDFTIPANFGQTQIRQYFDGTMSSGQGSVVVSSSQPLGAIVQIQARNQTPTQGAYTGYSGGSNKYYVPLAARRQGTASGLANSQIIIQNTDSVNLNVTVQLYQGNTLSYTKTISALKPGVSFYYDLDEEGSLPAPWIGSAVVTASNSGKIAVVSNFFTGEHPMQTFNAFPVESVSPRWVAPLFFSRLNNGLSTVVTVQNLSGSAIGAGGVTMTCTKDAATFPNGPATITAQNPASIAANASYSFNPVTDTTRFPNGSWGGSCRLDAGSANIVAIVQMRYVGGSSVNAAAYEAISETAATGQKLVVPLVAKQLSNGFASVVTVQNMSTSQSAQVTLVYTPSFNPAECPLAACDRNSDGKLDAADKITVGPLTIGVGQSVQRNHRISNGAGSETALPARWQGSLVATSANAPINGFVQLTNTSAAVGDTFMAHNAFVLP